jgi:CubicO group peptidase (beta-lactamase class C family)
VIHGGRLVLSDGLGVIDPGANRTPGPDTVYRIASMTKSFAALAILLLRDEGKLRLDAPAVCYAPQLDSLRYPTRDSAPITVRQLLTMAAGWPEDNPWGDRQLWRTDAQLDDLLAAGVTFANAPDVAFEYSNLGYMVLGRIIAQVSGQPSLQFITRRILQPLGMTDTVWQLADVDPQRLAPGYHWQGGAWAAEPLLPSGGDAAAFGGLYSTVADLARWVQCMLAAWPPRDDADDGLARRATLREMQGVQQLYTPTAAPPDLGQPVTWTAGGYGYGLSISYEGSLRIVGHAGGLPGFGSYMGWLPDYDLGIVALGNVRYATMRAAATAALRALVRQEWARPRPVPPAPALNAAVAAVNSLLQRWDDEQADQLFADNFFLDDSREQWQATMAELAAAHGALHMDGPLQPENALRGEWKLAGERGWVNAYLTLTPTVPPRVQELGFESVLPPGPRLQAALAKLVKLTARPTRRGVQALFAPQPHLPADQPSFEDQIRLLAALCGPCTLGDILAGDGQSAVRLRLAGPKAAVVADLGFDEATRRFVRARFQQMTR